MTCSLYYTQDAIKEVLLENIEESLPSPSEATLVRFKAERQSRNTLLVKQVNWPGRQRINKYSCFWIQCWSRHTF